MYSNSFCYETKKSNKNYFDISNDNQLNQETKSNNISHLNSSPLLLSQNENKLEDPNSYTFSSPVNKNTFSENKEIQFNSENSNTKSTNLSETLININSYYLNLYKKSEKELNELKTRNYLLEKENKEIKESLDETNKEKDEMVEKVDLLNNQLDKLINIIKEINKQKQLIEIEYINFKENKNIEMKNEYEEKILNIENENKEKIILLNMKIEELEKENEFLKNELKCNKEEKDNKEYKIGIDNEINEYKKDIEEKNDIIDKLKNEIKNLSEKMKEKENNFIDKEKDYKNEINKLNEINNDNNSKLNEIKNEYDLLIKKELINEKSIIDLKNNCLSKLNDNSNLKKELHKKTEEIEELSKEISRLERNIAYLSQNNFNLNQIIKSFQEN